VFMMFPGLTRYKLRMLNGTQPLYDSVADETNALVKQTSRVCPIETGKVRRCRCWRPRRNGSDVRSGSREITAVGLLRKASCVTGEHEADFRGARLKADLDVTESTPVKIADILLART